MSSNLFENFAFKYLEIIKSIDKKLIPDIKSVDIKKRCGIICRPKYINTDNISDLKFDFEYLESLTDNDCDMQKYLTLVKQFGEFIRTAEKCFMYNNSDDSEVRVYSEIDPETSTTIIYFNPCSLDIKIRIAFQDSAIDMPKQNNSLLNFIEGKENTNENDKVQFVQIDVQREFGKEMKNESKFILGSAVPMKDDTDEVLYENIKFITSEMVFDCFVDIIDNYMMKMTKLSNANIHVKDVVYNGIRIR